MLLDMILTMFQVSRYPDQELLVILSVSLFGLFGFSLYPICLELAVECTYPVAEATSSGFLIMSGLVLRTCKYMGNSLKLGTKL